MNELLNDCIHLAKRLEQEQGLEKVTVSTSNGKHIDRIGRIDVRDLGFLVKDAFDYCLKTGEELMMKK